MYHERPPISHEMTTHEFTLLVLAGGMTNECLTLECFDFTPRPLCVSGPSCYKSVC